MRSFTLASQPTCVICSPLQNDRFIVGQVNGTVSMYKQDGNDCHLQWEYSKGKSPVRALLFVTTEGSHIWSCSADGTVRVFTIDGGQLLHKYKNMHGTAPINCALQLEGDRGIVATGDENGTIKLWQQLKCIRQYDVNEDYISDMKYVPDARLLFVASGDGTLSVFHVAKDGLFAGTDSLNEEYECLQFVSNSQLLYAFGNGNSIDVYKWEYWGEPWAKIVDLDWSVSSVLQLKETFLVLGCSDGNIRLLKVPDNKVVNELKVEEFPIEKVCLVRDWILCLAHSNQIYLVNVDELMQESKEIHVHHCKKNQSKKTSVLKQNDFFADLV